MSHFLLSVAAFFFLLRVSYLLLGTIWTLSYETAQNVVVQALDWGFWDLPPFCLSRFKCKIMQDCFFPWTQFPASCSWFLLNRSWSEWNKWPFFFKKLYFFGRKKTFAVVLWGVSFRYWTWHLHSLKKRTRFIFIFFTLQKSWTRGHPFHFDFFTSSVHQSFNAEEQKSVLCQF